MLHVSIHETGNPTVRTDFTVYWKMTGWIDHTVCLCFDGEATKGSFQGCRAHLERVEHGARRKARRAQITSSYVFVSTRSA